MEGRSWRGFKRNGNKKTDRQWSATVRNGGRFYWSQDPQRTAVFEEEEKKKKKKKKKTPATFNDALQLHQFHCGQLYGGSDEYTIIGEEDRHVLIEVCGFNWKDNIK